MTRAASSLRFDLDGAQHFSGVARAAIRFLTNALARYADERPGTRLHGIATIDPLLAPDGRIGSIAAALIGPAARPVRAILFDKTADANWALGWHQDRTIAVRARHETPGFGPWTVKRGMPHVAPPFPLLARMATLRVHLDPVPSGNAPLLVAPGSHRALVREEDIAACVARCGVAACEAEPGDVWAYATPILHASNAAARPARRRVLQLDYSVDPLPGKLEWLGV